MNRRAVTFFALVSLFVIGCTGWSFAQDQDDVQQGIKAYGTYRAGDIDLVSMTNGNLTVDIPLVSYPQRGKAQLSFRLVYNNKNYMQKVICIAGECTTYITLTSLGSPLIATSDQSFSGKCVTIQETGGTETFQSCSLVSADGASHQLASLSSTVSETVDGTGFGGVGGFTTDANGTQYYGANGITTQEDVNGNQITDSGTALTDTVGRSIPNLPVMPGVGIGAGGSSGAGACPSGPLPVYSNYPWVVPGPNAGTSTFLFCYAQVDVVETFVDGGTNIWGDLNFLQSVVLPNGTYWTFQYSTDGYGDLKQITFPTGGTISYAWTGGSPCTVPLPPRYLTSRTVNANDGTGNHTWTYTGGIGTVTVEDPLGNNTVYTKSILSTCSTYITEVQYYQGAVQSANLLKTVSTTYSTTPSPFSASGAGSGSTMNIVPIQITTTWANGKTSQITKTYDSGFTFPSPRYNDQTQYTGLYGKVTVEKDYDYGNGAPGPLLKQINTCYLWQSTSTNANCSSYNAHYSSYLSNNMLNLVYSTQITDGTNQKAYTQYGYDETTPIAYSQTPQNLDLSVWTGTLRGNQTSANRWLNLPTVQTVTSKTTFYDTGMASVATDPL